MFAIVGDHTVLGKAHGVAALKSHGDERRWEEKDPGGVSHLLCRLLSLYIFPPHDAKNAHGRKEEGDVFSFDDLEEDMRRRRYISRLLKRSKGIFFSPFAIGSKRGETFLPLLFFVV